MESLLTLKISLIKCFEIAQMLKQKVAWLEASNMDLQRELEEARDRIEAISRCALESQVRRVFLVISITKKWEKFCKIDTSKFVFASSFQNVT